MGRLHIMAMECNYRELDWQLKEQFIHGLNTNSMLDEIIKELTATNSNDEIICEGVLAWAKRVEAQRAQATVLNTITESWQFDKVKIARKTKEDNTRCPTGPTAQQHPCRYCSGLCALRQCPAYRKMCVGCGKTSHFKKVWQSRRERAVNKMEVQELQEDSESKTETVSIDPVHLNKTQSLVTVKLEMQVGRNIIIIPYKLDMGSKGNIMPLFTFKKLFKNVTEEQLWKSIKDHIRLRTYNKTNITHVDVGFSFWLFIYLK